MGNQFAEVGGRYGAPMGRRESREILPVFHSVRCFRVRLDAGGYDDGGAYWGTGKPGEYLYCLDQIDSDFRVFLRADSRWTAMLKSGLALDMFRVLNLSQLDGRYTLTREYVGAARPPYVARFCDQWINSDSDKSKALEIIRQHALERMRGIGRV